MSKIKDREFQIEYVKNSMELSKMYANFWMAMATTGAATERDISQGRKVTPEEKAKGEIIGWTPLTDKEKINEALQTAMRHINAYRNRVDLLDALLRDNPESYEICLSSIT